MHRDHPDIIHNMDLMQTCGQILKEHFLSLWQKFGRYELPDLLRQQIIKWMQCSTEVRFLLSITNP